MVNSMTMPTPEDIDLITQTSRDYIEGRITADAEMLVECTRKGGGSNIPEAEQTYEIVVQDVFRHIACAKVISRHMMDHLHPVKLNERWFIVNVLWELREGEIGPD